MENGPASRTRSSVSAKENDQVSSPFLTLEKRKDNSKKALINDPEFKTPRKTKLRRSNRTPSGPNSIEDIRNFFPQNPSNRSATVNLSYPNWTTNVNSTENSDTAIVTSASVNAIRSQTAIELGQNKRDSGDPCPINVNKGSANYTSVDLVAPLGLNTSINNIEQYSIEVPKVTITDQTFKMSSQQAEGLSQLVHRGEKRQQIENMRKELDIKRRDRIVQQQTAKEAETKQNEKDRKEQEKIKESEAGNSAPQIMDVKVVLQMFRELKAEISSSKIEDGKNRLSTIEEEQDKQAEKILQLESRLEQVITTNQILTGVVSKLSQERQDDGHRIEMLEVTNAKRSVMVTGFHSDLKKSVCINEFYKFLWYHFKIELEIEEIYFPNYTTTSPMVITFLSQNDKRELFSKMSNLKGVTNKFDKPYIFSEYLPPKRNEQKMRERDIFREYNAPENENKVEWKMGRLKINDVPYTKSVKVPDVKEILTASEEDLDEAMDIDMKKGQLVQHNGNTFMAYTAIADNLRMVQKAYLKMKLLHPDANCIVCSFRVPGVATHETEDYCDDNEFNAGRTLLKWMTKNKLTSRMIFVLRYSNNVKIGPDRFTYILQAARNAILEDGIDCEPISARPKERNQEIQPESKRHRKPHFQPARKSLSKQRGALSDRTNGYPPIRGRGQNFSNNAGRRYEQLNQPRFPTSDIGPGGFQFREPEYVFENEWPSLSYKEATQVGLARKSFTP